MYLSVNEYNEVKKVGIDENLTVLFVDETREDFPFRGMSEARICCYRIKVKDGIIMMMTPYMDSISLDVIDQLGKSTETNKSDISDNRQGLTETFEATLTNTDDVAINRQAIEELFEMITAESEVK